MSNHLLRAQLPSGIPLRLRNLPVDERGYPVPYFVAWVNGKPDHRIADARKVANCHRQRLCWLCGCSLSKMLAFVVGPMCGINRISSDPPSHPDCAEWAARACPFLTRPRAKRRSAAMPDDVTDAPGFGLKRNPGVTLVWITESYQRVNVRGGTLSKMGEPLRVQFLCEGREATRAEINDSIDSGLPSLREAAESESRRAVWALEEMTRVFRAIVSDLVPEIADQDAERKPES